MRRSFPKDDISWYLHFFWEWKAVLLKRMYRLDVFAGHFMFVLESLFKKRKQEKWSSPWKVWLPQAIDSVPNIWNRIQDDSCIWVNTSNIQKCIKLNYVIYSVAVKLQIALGNMLKKIWESPQQSSHTALLRSTGNKLDPVMTCAWKSLPLGSRSAGDTSVPSHQGALWAEDHTGHQFRSKLQ